MLAPGALLSVILCQPLRCTHVLLVTLIGAAQSQTTPSQTAVKYIPQQLGSAALPSIQPAVTMVRDAPSCSADHVVNCFQITPHHECIHSSQHVIIPIVRQLDLDDAVA
jgi:hypothetical protein